MLYEKLARGSTKSGRIIYAIIPQVLLNASLQTGVLFGRMHVNECMLSVDELLRLKNKEETLGRPPHRSLASGQQWQWPSDSVHLIWLGPMIRYQEHICSTKYL